MQGGFWEYIIPNKLDYSGGPNVNGGSEGE